MIEKSPKEAKLQNVDIDYAGDNTYMTSVPPKREEKPSSKLGKVSPQYFGVEMHRLRINKMPDPNQTQCIDSDPFDR